MAHKNNPDAEPHYYSERLGQKLNLLSSSRSALVEAPSGYGKTTAGQNWRKN